MNTQPSHKMREKWDKKGNTIFIEEGQDKMKPQTQPKASATAEAAQGKSVCPNCGQWQHRGRNGYHDCLNDCAERNLAPRVTTHTPGPWRTNGIWVTGGEGQDICNVQADGIKLSVEQCWANARLIASAPELLAELKQVLRYGSAGNENLIRAAIAKAEGK